MRHGLSVHNQIGKFSGRINSPLTDEGRQDVKANAEELVGVNIDAIVSSPLSRALDSAKIIAEVIGFPEDKIIVSDLFSERDFGKLEGTPYSPLAVNDDVEDIESIEDLIKRAEKGFELLNKIDANDILLVSHGSLGRAMVFVISQDTDKSQKVKFHNAKIEQLI